MTYLLDVNLLIALCEPRHSHHEAAHRWFERRPKWATCPITENGFIRITGRPLFANLESSAARQVELLRTFCSLSTHSFWPDSLSLLDTRIWQDSRTLISSQVTDLYLLALAVKNGGKLASFDRSIPVHSVRSGKDALHLLPV
jgi:toxin-antitoxin system PIN domain toxin